MSSVDFVVLGIYLLGMFVVGLIFSRRNRTSSQMFNAGGQSPWWASGLSGFMTMFSANTFVVWGGIAYRQGMVAVAINLMYGVAAILVGWFVAGQWKRMGVQTPAEFVQLRFGTRVLHFYTWFMTILKIIGTAGALYALGRIMVAVLVGEFATTADLSNDPRLYWAIAIFGLIVISYTMFGGLWAVLMTDVLQFIILNLAVLFVIPLALLNAGGVSGFLEQAGEIPAVYQSGSAMVAGEGQTMLSLISGDYSMIFLLGWCAIHFFMIGAEWAFAQRFICVANPAAARKSAYLFGVLYLASPILWLLPPMLWRLQEPIPDGATPEQVVFLAENAYILSCKSVLPIGMLGLMVAAMFSATASMVSSQLNVFSGVLTNDIYKPLLKREPSEAQLVWAGRAFTVILGLCIIAIACAIPWMGGAERVVVEITELMVVALLAPTIWGMFSRKVGASAVFVTGLSGLTIGLLVRILTNMDFEAESAISSLADWAAANKGSIRTFTGVVLPVVILGGFEWFSQRPAPGSATIRNRAAADLEAAAAVDASPGDQLPALVVHASIASCGVILLSLIPFNPDTILMLFGFGSTLLLAGSILFIYTKRKIL